MKLYLARHGDYKQDWQTSLDTLSEKGRSDISRLATRLKQLDLHVDHILHSEKNRAKETAELLAEGVVSQHGIHMAIGLKPEDAVKDFAAEIEHFEADTLVVGHLPFMGRLVGELILGDETKEIVNFQTGVLVCLAKVERKRFMIDWVLTPSV